MPDCNTFCYNQQITELIKVHNGKKCEYVTLMSSQGTKNTKRYPINATKTSSQLELGS